MTKIMKKHRNERKFATSACRNGRHSQEKMRRARKSERGKEEEGERRGPKGGSIMIELSPNSPGSHISLSFATDLRREKETSGSHSRVFSQGTGRRRDETLEGDERDRK